MLASLLAAVSLAWLAYPSSANYAPVYVALVATGTFAAERVAWSYFHHERRHRFAQSFVWIAPLAILSVHYPVWSLPIALLIGFGVARSLRTAEPPPTSVMAFIAIVSWNLLIITLLAFQAHRA